MRTNLGDPSWIALYKSAEASEGGVLLLVVSNLVQSLTPCLSKFREVRSHQCWVHEADTTDGDSCVLVKTPWCLGMEQDGYQP